MLRLDILEVENGYVVRDGFDPGTNYYSAKTWVASNIQALVVLIGQLADDEKSRRQKSEPGKL